MASTTDSSAPITIRLGNEDFSLERRKVAVEWLRLDPKNQRLRHEIQQKQVVPGGGAVTDEQLHKLLWDLDPIKDLYQSVLQNGGLIEDPIVTQDGIVVEGNSRTVVLRELGKKYPENSQWSNVYVRLLPHNVTEEQLVTLLGELHIAGKIEWRAYDQAEYVWRMNKEFSRTYDFLAAHLRWSRSKIAQKIGAFEETRQYLEDYNDPKGVNRFSHFEEFMKKKELRERREQDAAFMEEFRSWVYHDKFPGATDIRKLPDVLMNERALEALRSYNIQAAEAVLNEADPSRNSDLYYSIDQAVAQLRSASLSEVRDLQKGDSLKLEKLAKLQQALDELARMAGVRLSS